jgi:hypothetical protein
MSKLRWQDVVNVLVGLWVATSPWVLGFVDNYYAAMWNALVVGIAIIVLELVDIDWPAAWEEWLSIALGAWLIASPWVFGFADFRVGLASSVASGIVVIVLAAWALFSTLRVDTPNQHATGH